MKNVCYKYGLIGILLLSFSVVASCRDRNDRNMDDQGLYGESEQERYHDPNADPLNEQDISGGTIDNNQTDTINRGTDTVGDGKTTTDRTMP